MAYVTSTLLIDNDKDIVFAPHIMTTDTGINSLYFCTQFNMHITAEQIVILRDALNRWIVEHVFRVPLTLPPAEFKVGDQVRFNTEGFSPIGVVHEIDGDAITVAWETGATSTLNASRLRHDPIYEVGTQL